MKHLLLPLMWLACLWARGQTITVVDEATSQPVAEAQIHNPDTKAFVVTNAKGQVDIASLKATGDIFVLHYEYHTQVVTTSQLGAQSNRIALRQKTVLLEEVVISASKFEEKREDVAQQVQVIDRRELSFMNQPTSAEVLSQSGQVLVQKSQLGGGSPILRGFEANKVLLVIDGVRMNNLIYRGGHLQNILTLDNNALDRVEVMFGPGSVVYGSDALGGVMHFQTRRPLLADSSVKGLLVKGEGMFRYGTAAQEKTGHLHFNIGGKRLASFTSLTWSDFNDLRQGNVRNPFYGDWGKVLVYADRINGIDTALANPDPNLQVGTGYSQYDVIQKLLFRHNARLTHQLNVQFSTSSDVPRFDRLSLLQSSGKPRFAEWYYGPQTRLLAAYTAELSGLGRWMDAGRVILAYQSIEESRHDRRFGSSFRNSRVEQVKVMSLNADFEKRTGRHEIRYGLEAVLNALQSTAVKTDIVADTTAKLDTRYPDGDNSMTTAALYATHTWEISEKLILQDGLRASFVSMRSTWEDTTFFPFPFREVTQTHQALNGNLGMVYKPGGEWRFSLLGSSGFRAPNVDDLAKVFESTPGTIVVPNPDLGPEYVWNGEVSVGKSRPDYYHAQLTGWYSLYQNAITTLPGTFLGADSVMYDGVLSAVTMNQNAAKAHVYGVSGILNAELSMHFSLSSALTYTFGRIRTDTVPYPLDHIPPVYGRTGVTLKMKKFRGEAYALYNGWKRLRDYNLIGEDNFSYATPYGTPAWFTLNLRASYQVVRNASIQVAVENLLDQNYRVFASGLSAPGRNLVVTLRGTF